MSGPTYRRVRKITWPCKFSTSCAGDALPSSGGDGTYCAKHKHQIDAVRADDIAAEAVYQDMLAHPESVVDAQDLF